MYDQVHHEPDGTVQRQAGSARGTSREADEVRVSLEYEGHPLGDCQLCQPEHDDRSGGTLRAGLRTLPVHPEQQPDTAAVAKWEDVMSFN